MRADTRNWLFTATLAGLLLLGTGVAKAQTGAAPPPDKPKPGTRADRKEDKAEARQLRDKIEDDRERLQADVRQFGKKSPQAQADRRQLRADRRAFDRVQDDRQRDRRIAQRRRHRKLG